MSVPETAKEWCTTGRGDSEVDPALTEAPPSPPGVGEVELFDPEPPLLVAVLLVVVVVVAA